MNENTTAPPVNGALPYAKQLRPQARRATAPMAWNPDKERKRQIQIAVHKLESAHRDWRSLGGFDSPHPEPTLKDFLGWDPESDETPPVNFAPQAPQGIAGTETIDITPDPTPPATTTAQAAQGDEEDDMDVPGLGKVARPVKAKPKAKATKPKAAPEPVIEIPE